MSTTVASTATADSARCTAENDFPAPGFGLTIAIVRGRPAPSRNMRFVRKVRKASTTSGPRPRGTIASTGRPVKP